MTAFIRTVHVYMYRQSPAGVSGLLNLFDVAMIGVLVYRGLYRLW